MSVIRLGKYKIVALVLSMVLPLVLHAQSPYFSQYYASPLYLNPALAGAERAISFGVNYRSQWNSNNAPYQLGQFSFIYPILTNGARLKHLGGVGLSIYQDIAGEGATFQTYGASLSGSYRIAINKSNTVLTGLQAGMIQKRIDFSQLQWGSQYDEFVGFDDRITPSVGDLSEQTTFPVFDAGIFWHCVLGRTNYFTHSRGWTVYTGLSASNLNQPDESLLKDGQSRLSILYKLHGGLDYRASRSFKLTPSYLILAQGSNRQYNFGTYFTYTIIADPFSRKPKTFDFQLGIWRRLKDSYTFMIGGSGRNISGGFSYDMNTTSMRYNNLGKSAYEISLKYKISKGKEIRRFSTPLM